jgi:lysyl-tRNA synthetase class 2
MRTDAETIADIDYDIERAKLVVRFRDGHGLVYVGVPGEVHRSFVHAPSRQGFFEDEIVERYPYNRLDG